MPFAVTLCFDPPSAAAIAKIWEVLASKGIDTDRHQLGYAPHITLAIYPDEAPAAQLMAALRTLAATWSALPVTLSGLGIFPSSSAVFWAAPVVTPALLARHAAVQAALPDLQAHAHYHLGAWVPLQAAAWLAPLIWSWHSSAAGVDRPEMLIQPGCLLDLSQSP